MEKGLLQRIDDLEENKNGKKKKSKYDNFRLPFGLRSGSKAKVRKNYVLGFIIRSTGSLDIKWLQIQNGMVYLKENQTYHEVKEEDIRHYKKYPYIWLPENSLTPLRLDDIIQGIKPHASDQKFIIRASKLGLLKGGTKLSGKTIFVVLIVLSIIVYFLYNSSVG